MGLAPSEAILLEEVESKPSISLKRSIGKDEITLKKGDSVRYLLANAKWEGGMEAVRRSTDPIWSPSLHKVRKIVVSKMNLCFIISTMENILQSEDL